MILRKKNNINKTIIIIILVTLQLILVKSNDIKILDKIKLIMKINIILDKSIIILTIITDNNIIRYLPLKQIIYNIIIIKVN